MRVESASGAPRQRVVLDTNVWLSAWLSSHGAPAQVVRRAVMGADVVFTAASFDELQTRLWRPKFDRYLSMDRRKQLLHDVAAVAFWADVPAALAGQAMCRDPDDDRIVHAALAGGARWLVSGDQDLLVMAHSLRGSGVAVVSPSVALRAQSFCSVATP